MFPTEIQSDMTIYNLYEDSTGLHCSLPSVIKGVFWQSNFGADMAAKGIVTADKISVMILKNARVEGKTYLLPHEYMKIPREQKDSFWTITKGDRIINAAVTDTVAKPAELEKKYGHDNVFTVTNIIINDFGPANMRHFTVIGK